MFGLLAGANKVEQLRGQVAALNRRMAAARTNAKNATPHAAQDVLAKLVGTNGNAIGGITLLGPAMLIEILALVMAASAFEQCRHLIGSYWTVPVRERDGRLNAADDYSGLTDEDQLGEPIDPAPRVATQPSLKRTAPASNVTPLRSRRTGSEGLSLPAPSSDAHRDCPAIAATPSTALWLGH